MNDIDGGPQRTRQEMWDERHAAREPIESPEPDPTLVEEIGPLAPGGALDLGAGDGRNAVWLAQQGWHVTAVDFSQVALDRGRALAEREGVDVDWVRADLLAWTPPSRAFDLVCLVYIHLPREERRLVYARAAEAVAPGGSLLVVAHDRTNLDQGGPGPQDPAVLFTAEEVAADLPDLVVARAETVTRPLDAGRLAIDAVMRAVRPRG
ncbi:MAG: class I SAM-dependent methyltransferase [Chloroflexota bacterium]